tara:strand:- start:560 stop:934 length:375 start_codon:yes stop_codon:yes gene_type:complete
MPIYNINVKTIQLFSFSIEAENEQIARAIVDHHYDKLCDPKLPAEDGIYDGTKSKYYFRDWTPMLEVLENDTGDAFPQPEGAIAWAGEGVLLYADESQPEPVIGSPCNSATSEIRMEMMGEGWD